VETAGDAGGGTGEGLEANGLRQDGDGDDDDGDDDNDADDDDEEEEEDDDDDDDDSEGDEPPAANCFRGVEESVGGGSSDGKMSTFMRDCDIDPPVLMSTPGMPGTKGTCSEVQGREGECRGG
jgi:hypothetical protein